MATPKEIEQEFIEHFRGEAGLGANASFYDLWDSFVYESLFTKESIQRYEYCTDLILPSGNVYLVEDFGGEGQGDERWVVFSVGDQLFRVEGSYASWDGTTWDYPSLEEVEPIEVVKIEYAGVK